MMKRCSKCGETKPVSEFSRDRSNKKDGHCRHCKACNAKYRAENKERIFEYQAKYRAEHLKERSEYDAKFRADNKEKIAKQHAEYHAANREKILKQKAEYRASHREEIAKHREENRDKIAEQNAKHYYANRDNILKRQTERRSKRRVEAAEYRAAHREERTEYHRNRMANDIQYKLACNLRSRLYKVVKGNCKSGSAVRDLGCTIAELKDHLEKQFQEGMSWDNYGEWHVDHIVPLASFDLTDREQLLAACHYTNLQPMWGSENCSKGAKLEESCLRD